MPSDPGGPKGLRALRASLLRWYRRSKRDLPWRRTRDPYAIWVSEAMLQQTTVAAVIPYWERFLERFPDLASLARSREEDVLAAWSGLGYYRRATALREAAATVMERHGGMVPEDPEALEALPGVGPYTAGAIASLAFGREAPVVDGNVRRVLSRLLGRRDLGASEAWAVAGALVRGPSPGDLNQAVMELGATVCTPRAPACSRCPLRGPCVARASGAPETYPAPRPARASRAVPAAAAWVERRGRVLLERRRPDGVLRGLWDLPTVALGAGEDPGAAIAAALERHHGIAARPGAHRAAIRHAILGSRLEVTVVSLEIDGRVPRSPSLRWARPDRLDAVPHSGATRKAIEAVRAQKRSHTARPSRSRSSASRTRGRPKA